MLTLCKILAAIPSSKAVFNQSFRELTLVIHSRSSPNQLSVMPTCAKRQRSDKQKVRRAQREKFRRQTCQKLPKSHEWLHGLAPDAKAALEGSERLTMQEAAGLSPIVGQVLGRGSTSSECIAKVDGACTPEQLLSIDSEILYQRLCEMQALKEEVARHMLLLMDTLAQRKFLFAKIVKQDCESVKIKEEPKMKVEPKQKTSLKKVKVEQI